MRAMVKARLSPRQVLARARALSQNNDHINKIERAQSRLQLPHEHINKMKMGEVGHACPLFSEARRYYL